MSKRYPVGACIVLAITITGCQRATDPPMPMSSAETSKSADKSVALPPNAVPQPDAAIKPSGPDAATTAQAAAASQASPKELDKQQESTAMPLPGQVNNHSTPVPLEKK